MLYFNKLLLCSSSCLAEAASFFVLLSSGQPKLAAATYFLVSVQRRPIGYKIKTCWKHFLLEVSRLLIHARKRDETISSATGQDENLYITSVWSPSAGPWQRSQGSGKLATILVFRRQWDFCLRLVSQPCCWGCSWGRWAAVQHKGLQ